MSRELVPYSLFRTQCDRLAAVAKMRESFAVTFPKEDAIKKQLYDLAPPSMKRYLDEEEDLLQVVLDLGRNSTFIFVGRAGFANKQQIRTAVRDLQKAWGMQVVVELGLEESDRFTIRFFAANSGSV